MVRQHVARGAPGTPGNWCLEDFQKWVDQNVTHRGESRPRHAELPGPADLFLGGPASPALELYRKRRAAMALLELRERRGNLVPRERIHELLGRVAALIRGAGEQLQRQFGADAAGLLEESLNDAEAEIEAFFADVDDHRESPTQLDSHGASP